MELMLIVWLVSILSGIKTFVSTYLVFIVASTIGLFALTKLNKNILTVTGKLRVQRWQDGEVYLQDSLAIGDKVIPAGTLILLDQFSSYAYVTCSQLGIVREQVCRSILEPKIKVVIAPDVQNITVPAIVGKLPRQLSWLCYTLIGLQLLLPSDTTMKYMAGAYLLQSSYQSEFVQTALPLGQKAVLNQLKRWSEDSEELKDLLVEQVKEQK